MKAMERGDTDRLDTLLQSSDRQSLNFKIQFFSPLLKSVSHNKSDIVEQLLCAGASVFWGFFLFILLELVLISAIMLLGAPLLG